MSDNPQSLSSESHIGATKKDARPEGFHPATIDEGISTPLNLSELYEKSKGEKIGTGDYFGHEITPEQQQLDYYHGLRMAIWAARQESMSKIFGKGHDAQITEAANVISSAEAANLVGQKLQTEKRYVEARTDLLTQLPNRQAFYERLKNQIDQGVPYGILMVDIDKFKSVNDTYGHTAGDMVLMQSAARILGCIRQARVVMPDGTENEERVSRSDMAARYGGEEIAILVSNIRSKEELDMVGERIVEAFNKEKFITSTDKENPQEIVVTASVGGAMPLPGEGNQTIERADKNLYSAKELGRNRYKSEEPKPQ